MKNIMVMICILFNTHIRALTTTIHAKPERDSANDAFSGKLQKSGNGKESKKKAKKILWNSRKDCL